ncbi:V-type ATP synthase subunit I [Dethiosulfatibacter aminovorans]|uniref:V-type ATP synthase subunit I n=1 Tax=Dethiosulfatibacter aminovorans TaxID=332095 RepID=UPI00093276E5|nr:V-type ATPase 116kDa subunit family protein [Dethiosulfatibacter aminovorans]
MAVKKLNMMNIVCKNEYLDELLRDLILEENCQFINTITEIEEGDFSIGMTEENADEILDMEDIVPLKENSVVTEYLDKMNDFINKLEYAPEIKKEHMLGEHRFENIKNEIDEVVKKFEKITDDMQTVKNSLKKLDSMGFIDRIKNINVDFKELMDLDFFTMKFGFLTREKRRKISQNYENIMAVVLHIGAYEEKELYIIISPKSLDLEMSRILRSTDFVEIEIDSKYLSYPYEMERMIAADRKKYENELMELRKTSDEYMVEYRDTIERLYSKIVMESKIDNVRTKVAATRNFCYISAWIPEEHNDSYGSIFERYSNTLVTYKDAEDVSNKIPIPTFLKNFFFFRPFETLVNMYGVPSHDEMDTTVFFGLVYMFFFGAMFGDLGQGMVFVGAGFFLEKRGMANFGSLMWRIGLGSVFFGIIYDSFFGYEHIISKYIPLPIYIRPMDNINTILLAAVASGVVLLLISYGCSIFNKVKAEEFGEAFFGRNGINGMALFLTLLALIYGMVEGSYIIPKGILYIILAISIILLILEEPLGNLLTGEKPLYREPPAEYYTESGFNVLETFLSILSNGISFIRIGAFALNHVGLFIAFQTVADMIGSRTGNVAMFIIGNIVIIGLEGLIVFIQGLRLFYYELFSKYYKGEGVLFSPDKI